MKSLAEVKRYIDSFPRPNGYNTYAWNVTKKTALEVWRCYFENKTYYRPLNYLCAEFYDMIRTQDGTCIINGKSL